MIVKVCGLISNDAIESMSSIGIEWVGLNFYPKSKRYLATRLKAINDNIKKVGVFVNSDLATIKEKKNIYNLDYIQLHGDEDVNFCKAVQSFCPVIKVFRINDNFDFRSTDLFSFCDYFLFDTATDDYGGSGKKFKWDILNHYKSNVKFLLAGGIDITDAKAIQTIQHPQFFGIDINSKFEITPGIKDSKKVKLFIKALNTRL